MFQNDKVDEMKNGLTRMHIKKTSTLWKELFHKNSNAPCRGEIGKGRNLNDYENIFLWNKINELTWLMSIISVMQWHILAATGTPMEAKEADE